MPIIMAGTRVAVERRQLSKRPLLMPKAAIAAVLISGLAASCLLSTPAEAQWKGIRRDAASLAQSESILVLLGGLTLARAARSWDAEANGPLADNPLLNATDFTNPVNRTSFNIPVAFLLWSFSKDGLHGSV